MNPFALLLQYVHDFMSPYNFSVQQVFVLNGDEQNKATNPRKTTKSRADLALGLRPINLTSFLESRER